MAQFPGFRRICGVQSHLRDLLPSVAKMWIRSIQGRSVPRPYSVDLIMLANIHKYGSLLIDEGEDHPEIVRRR